MVKGYFLGTLLLYPLPLKGERRATAVYIYVWLEEQHIVPAYLLLPNTAFPPLKITIETHRCT